MVKYSISNSNYRFRHRLLPLLLIGGIYYLYTRSYTSTRTTSTSYLARQAGTIKTIDFKDPIPLISLITIFVGNDLPSTIPYFLQSIARQPKALELVFIQREGCSDLTDWTKNYSNIKHVCLSENQFWKLHADYFCDYWGGCTKMFGKQMLEDMKNLGKIKNPQSVYPILRGWVFQKYISKNAMYWGFADPDTFMGDFSQTFPYDQASNSYDIIIPTEPTDTGGPRLLFMRGHLTIFRNTKGTKDKMMRYEYFRSADAWEEMGVPSAVAEEAEYSHFVVGEPRLNLLFFDGMMPVTPVRSSSIVGLLTLPDSLIPTIGKVPTLKPNIIRALTTPSIKSPKYPSFTLEGIERSIRIVQGERPPPSTQLWFDEDLVSWYNSQPIPIPKHDTDSNPSQGSHTHQRWRRYLIKRDNEWKERLEPKREFRGNYMDGGIDHAYQWLYAHWQEDKRKSHWKNIPQTTPSDILMIYEELGNAGFDSTSGQRKFWLEKKEESCTSAGCVNVGEELIEDRETYKYYTSTIADMADWYIESKKIRMGLSTNTLGPDPSKPTA